MTSAYDFIESAIKSIEKSKEYTISVKDTADSGWDEDNLGLAIGHIDDAISELNEAKAMLY